MSTFPEKLTELLASAHCAVYTYGVVAAYADDSHAALDNQAIHRQLRDKLIASATLQKIAVPEPALAYALPMRVTNNNSAMAVAALLENRLCNQWATDLFYLERTLALELVTFPQECAVRAFMWSGVTSAFPH